MISHLCKVSALALSKFSKSLLYNIGSGKVE